jgi:protein-S-isoprenylcysteine O-methyltransferase Ste14
MGSAAQKGGSKMQSHAWIRYAIREILGLLVMGVALFWSAGRIDWWAAWAALEDRTLQADLIGYSDYARRVRFRLLPGIW